MRCARAYWADTVNNGTSATRLKDVPSRARKRARPARRRADKHPFYTRPRSSFLVFDTRVERGLSSPPATTVDTIVYTPDDLRGVAATTIPSRTFRTRFTERSQRVWRKSASEAYGTVFGRRGRAFRRDPTEDDARARTADK